MKLIRLPQQKWHTWWIAFHNSQIAKELEGPGLLPGLVQLMHDERGCIWKIQQKIYAHQAKLNRMKVKAHE